MHYIRFLKSPSVHHSKGPSNVHFTAKITITTDLGESFACVGLPLVVRLLDNDGRSTSYPFVWKREYRQLEISFSRERQGLSWPCRLVVECQDYEIQVNTLDDVLRPPLVGHGGRVLSLMSEPFYDLATSKSRRLQRLLGISAGESLCIWEETGESIARHVWDAGLVLSAYLDSYSSISHSNLPQLSTIQRLLSKPHLEVVELGSGCGVVGITFSKCFLQANVLLTDLPQAQEIALLNISTLCSGTTTHSVTRNVKYDNLEWEDPLPVTLQNGDLDLVLVADCTYNPSVIPDLVKTLAAIVKHNPAVLILLAMKVRHDSEKIFFDLMLERQMKIVERLVLPLPLLGQDDEEIEIYLFVGPSEGKAVTP